MRALPSSWAAIGLTLLFFAPNAAAGPPQIGPAWTAGVGTTAASLRTEVNPNGLATTYHFSYLPEAAYQANLGAGKDGFTGAAKAPPGVDPSIDTGVVAVIVSQTVGSLSPDVAYRYRVEAANSVATEVGPSRVFTTEAFAGASPLLDGRVWELVSAADKGSGEVGGPGESLGGGTIQAAAQSSSLTYSSTTAYGAEVKGAPPASQYVSRRGAAGWSTENISAATVAGAYGPEPDGAPYQLFSGDLSRALMLDGNRCEVGDPCPFGYSLRDGSGTPLSTSPARPDLRLVGASADLAQSVLSTCAALTADATEVAGPEGCDPAQPNLYRWSAGGLSLVNLLPAAVQGTPGATLASQLRAVAGDGSRVYWMLGGDLYLREGATTKQVDDTVGGGGSFETASVDGAVAFFSNAGHLYRYEAPADTVTDLTPGGDFVGALGASSDGSYLYYLTAAGLFLRHGATTTKVADSADASNYPPAIGTARVTPDGTHLAFLSKASLTGYDNRKREVGLVPPGPPQTEVFLYDAGSGSLVCVSCHPTGEQPIGPSTIPGAVANGKSPTATRAYKPRALSDDGRRLFFDSAADLAITDTGQRPDVYEWEAQGRGSCLRAGGCVALISAGRNSEGASFLDASTSGDDVFFFTEDSLVGADGGLADAYDARVGGGFPAKSIPIECIGDDCQFLPSEPDDPTPGTLVPSPGNPPLRITSEGRRCKRGFVKKRGKCVKVKRQKGSKRGARR